MGLKIDLLSLKRCKEQSGVAQTEQSLIPNILCAEILRMEVSKVIKESPDVDVGPVFQSFPKLGVCVCVRTRVWV